VVVAALVSVIDVRASHEVGVRLGECINAPAWVLVFIRSKAQPAVPYVEGVGLSELMCGSRVLVGIKRPRKLVHAYSKHTAWSVIRVDIKLTSELRWRLVCLGLPVARERLVVGCIVGHVQDLFARQFLWSDPRRVCLVWRRSGSAV